MAKKRKTKAESMSTEEFAESVAPRTTPPTPVVAVPTGGTLVIIVDVGPTTIPYTVSYAGHTLIKALVDRAEQVPLMAGQQVLGWAFAHVDKGWHHTIAYSINGGPPVVLESRSEARKDQDHSIGFAVVRV